MEEAIAELNSAQAEEAQVKEDLALREAFDDGSAIPTDSDYHKKVMKDSIKKHESRKTKIRKKRLACQKDLEERIKARDLAIDRINNDTLVKKPNQIYCSNGTYTARWTTLPA